MQSRRHHNNKGYRQIKRGKTYNSLQYIIKKLKLNVGDSSNDDSRRVEKDKDTNKES